MGYFFIIKEKLLLKRIFEIKFRYFKKIRHFVKLGLSIYKLISLNLWVLSSISNFTNKNVFYIIIFEKGN